MFTKYFLSELGPLWAILYYYVIRKKSKDRCFYPHFEDMKTKIRERKQCFFRPFVSGKAGIHIQLCPMSPVGVVGGEARAEGPGTTGIPEGPGATWGALGGGRLLTPRSLGSSVSLPQS